MARPTTLLLDEPTLGLAPLMAARIAETIKEINSLGTSVLLVEQNVAMALSLASHALRPGGRRGRPWRAPPPTCGPATRCAALPRHRRRRGGRPPDAHALEVVVTATTAYQPDGMEPLEVRDVTVRFAGLTALDGVELHRGSRDRARRHRAQRGREVDLLQRAVGGLPGHVRERAVRRGRAHRAEAAPDRGAGRRPDLPEHRAVAPAAGVRQPPARPPPADVVGVRVGGAAAAERPAGAAAARRARR